MMMIANPNSTCERARRYYYEYYEHLCGAMQESIPRRIVAHIEECAYCKGEVKRLSVMLSEAQASADETSSRRDFVTATNLRLHYLYVGAFVRCETVRPFLPSFAVPALAMRVPTPITVHIDKCEQCAQDLKVVRSLNLTDKQLYRLGELFAEEAEFDSEVCVETRSVLDSGGLSIFKDGSAERLRHLCVCPECRRLLEECWERMGEDLSESFERSWVPCDVVSAADVFDCVVPYGFGPEQGEDASFCKSVMSHVLNCPKCRQKMEGVRKAVYGIMEREESGVVTCYRAGESEQASVASGGDNLYEDWPIDVQVLGRSRRVAVESGAGPGVSEAPGHRALNLKLRQFIRPAVAAAIFLAAGFMLFSGPAAKAFDLGQIYRALGRVKNVCIIRSGAEETDASTEVWVSRELNIKMFRTAQECVLWDIKAKSRKSKDLVTGSLLAVTPDDNAFARVEGTMDAPWGLLPFDDISNLPKGAEWKAAADEDVETTIPGTRVYDLTWAQKGPDGLMVHNKWRAYIDIETKLLRRAEWWKRNAGEEEYGLAMAVEVRYPSIGEVEAAVGDAGF